MDYIDKIIYDAIITRIKAQTAWIQTEGHTEPKAIEWYNGQYDKQAESLPFTRPAILIEFGNTEWEPTSLSKRKGIVPITLHIVQDLLVQGRDGGAQHAAFKELLDYPYVINELVDGWSQGCFKKMVLTGTARDHGNDNLMVHLMSYQCEAVLNRSANPVD